MPNPYGLKHCKGSNFFIQYKISPPIFSIFLNILHPNIQLRADRGNFQIVKRAIMVKTSIFFPETIPTHGDAPVIDSIEQYQYKSHAHISTVRPIIKNKRTFFIVSAAYLNPCDTFLILPYIEKRCGIELALSSERLLALPKRLIKRAAPHRYSYIIPLSPEWGGYKATDAVLFVYISISMGKFCENLSQKIIQITPFQM